MVKCLSMPIHGSNILHMYKNVIGIMIHNLIYRTVKNFSDKEFGVIVCLKHWGKDFSKSKACLYF